MTENGSRLIRPYGDTANDGMVQMSFTLPVPPGKAADAAALQLAGQMGIEAGSVAHSHGIDAGHTFFVVYGRVTHPVDLDALVVAERDYPLLTPREVNQEIKAALRRRLVVVGACIGTDAHTVGIDAILNIKGVAGEKGLEYYREIKVVNLGSQVAIDDLIRRIGEEAADAVLVSQVVTQRDAHLTNTRALAEALRLAYLDRPRPVLIVGGPRFDELQADQLGVDKIFGRGTTPSDVASYLVAQLDRIAGAAR